MRRLDFQRVPSPVTDQIRVRVTEIIRAIFIGMALSILLVGAASGALELTPDNFDDVVFGSGKAAFIKFLAPW